MNGPSRSAAFPMSSVALILIGALGIVGAVITLYATKNGAGTSPDSIVYIGAAHNLLAGRGLTEAFGSTTGLPLNRYPPLYPALLAALGAAGTGSLHTVRGLNALLFTALIIFSGVILARTLKGSTWLPVIGSAAIVTSLALVVAHTMVWSEPLFLMLSLVALYLIAQSTSEPGWRILILAATVTALAQLTRYAALPVVATGVLSILLFDVRAARQRFGRALTFGTISLAPVVLWGLRNVSMADTATGRTVRWHPVGKAQAWEALNTISGWLQIPSSTPGLVRLGIWVAVTAGTALVLVLLARTSAPRTTATPIPVFFKVAATFVVVYGVFLLLSLSLLDASTPLDDRILSPIFLMGVFLTLFLAWKVTRETQLPAASRAALTALIVLFLGLGAWRLGQWTAVTARQASGFSSASWQRSETLKQVAELPHTIEIVSNAPEAIYLYTQRPAKPFPRRVRAATQRPNDGYAREMAELEQNLRDQHAVVVFFDALSLRASEAELTQALGLCPQWRASDGTIYGGSPEGSAQCSP